MRRVAVLAAALIGGAPVYAQACTAITFAYSDQRGRFIDATLGMDGRWVIDWQQIERAARYSGNDVDAVSFVGLADLFLAARGRIPETDHLDTTCPAPAADVTGTRP